MTKKGIQYIKMFSSLY